MNVPLRAACLVSMHLAILGLSMIRVSMSFATLKYDISLTCDGSEPALRMDCCFLKLLLQSLCIAVLVLVCAVERLPKSTCKEEFSLPPPTSFEQEVGCENPAC